MMAISRGQRVASAVEIDGGGPAEGDERTARAMTAFKWAACLTLVTAACAGAGCRSPAQRFSAAIRGADTVVLLEGLPHQTWERELLEQERKSKPVQELHGYPFYKEPLDLRPEDAKRLTQVLADPSHLKPVEGQKLCGGFHPDYTVEWHHGSDTFHALVCLGCDEVKLFGPEIDLYDDLSQSAAKELETLLGGYHKNRPAPKSP
jgi:hypothetical protein